MLRSLRKLRRKVLAQKNITSYILYALGEIFLIVIGVLIAININNKNSYRTELWKFKGSLENVIEDLKKDSIDIVQLKEYYTETSGLASNFIDNYILSKPLLNSNKDSNGWAKIISEKSFERNIFGLDKAKKSIFFDMNETKNIRIILYEYKKEISAFKRLEHNQNLHTEAMEKELWTNGFYDSLWVIERKKLGYSDFDWQKQFDKYPQAKGLLMRYEFVMNKLSNQCKLLLETNEELKNEIQKFLSTNK